MGSLKHGWCPWTRMLSFQTSSPGGPLFNTTTDQRTWAFIVDYTFSRKPDKTFTWWLITISLMARMSTIPRDLISFWKSIIPSGFRKSQAHTNQDFGSFQTIEVGSLMIHKSIPVSKLSLTKIRGHHTMCWGGYGNTSVVPEKSGPSCGTSHQLAKCENANPSNQILATDKMLRRSFMRRQRIHFAWQHLKPWRNWRHYYLMS